MFGTIQFWNSAHGFKHRCELLRKEVDHVEQDKD